MKFLCTTQLQFKVMNDLRLVHVKSVHDKQCTVYAEDNSRYVSSDERSLYDHVNGHFEVAMSE